jgi:hypothetical protein
VSLLPPLSLSSLSFPLSFRPRSLARLWSPSRHDARGFSLLRQRHRLRLGAFVVEHGILRKCCALEMRILCAARAALAPSAAYLTCALAPCRAFACLVFFWKPRRRWQRQRHHHSWQRAYVRAAGEHSLCPRLHAQRVPVPACFAGRCAGQEGNLSRDKSDWLTGRRRRSTHAVDGGEVQHIRQYSYRRMGCCGLGSPAQLLRRTPASRCSANSNGGADRFAPGIIHPCHVYNCFSNHSSSSHG